MFLDDLGKPLKDYMDQIDKERPGLIKKVRHVQQMGLSQSRITGWQHATGDAVAILDAHIEATQGWRVQSNYQFTTTADSFKDCFP